MSTHNIGFLMKKKAKLSLNYNQISSNTHLIYSAVEQCALAQDHPVVCRVIKLQQN